MERARRLGALWNWLPAFRAVAETEHLPSAAAALFTSPASLSRTIGLLEEELGTPLFDRVGRRLQLNRAGRRLLDAVRDGMRVIDEGVVSVEGQEWSGPIVMWAPAVYARSFLLALVEHLRGEHERIETVILSREASSVADRILRGQIDLALTETPPVHEHLRCEVFKELHYGLYCHPDHPLASAVTLTIDEILEHSFAVPLDDSLDRWPVEFPRSKQIVVEDMSMAIVACHSMKELAVLPGLVTEGLCRLPIDLDLDAKLYVVYRRPVGGSARISSLVQLAASLSPS